MASHTFKFWILFTGCVVVEYESKDWDVNVCNSEHIYLFLLLRGKLKGLERFRLIFVGTSLLQIYCYIASLFYINNSIQSYGEIYKRIKTFPSPFDYVDVTAYIFVFIQLIILIIMYFDTIVDILKLRNHKVISKLIVKISQHW